MQSTHVVHEAYVQTREARLCYENLMPEASAALALASRLNRSEGELVPVLLVMGMACQMTVWPPEFLSPLLAHGRRVIRFDNRDIGRSSEVTRRIKGLVPLAFARYKLGLPVEAAYRLTDLAQDTLALMDALQLRRVHLVGVSMGGMISQIVAANAPERVASLGLMMTSDNSAGLPMADPRVLWAMNGGGVKGHDRESALKRGLAFRSAVQSPAYPTPQERLIQRIAHDFERSYRPASILRQMRAVLATGSIASYTRRITAPTLILHGQDDPLVRPQAAQHLARQIPQAAVELIPGWGHDLPPGLCPRLAQHLLEHFDQAETSEPALAS